MQTKEMNQELKETEKVALLEGMYQLDQQNSALRGGNKHVLNLGVARLEIVPTSKGESVADVFKCFTKFAKDLKKLHGDKHLVVRFEGEAPLVPTDSMIN